MTLRLSLALAAAALAACSGVPGRAPGTPAARPPNIVFILADDLGWGDLGCYGQPRLRTPRLDRLAEQGTRFTNAYAGSTVCAPSRCALMTGLHTGHGRVRGNARVPLAPEDVTVAEVLRSAGYATGLIGKWGLGEPETTGVPGRQGFDAFFGYLNQHHAHDYYTDHLWRGAEKFPIPENAGGTRRVYTHDLFVREALDFLDRHRGGPFFLYLAFTLPHANNERGKEGMEVPDDAPYSAEPWPQPERNRAAMITRLDADVGRVLDRLKELGLEDDTLVIFTSDNGPHKEGGSDAAFFNSSGPLRGIKRDLYEGGVRVPLIVRWPGRTPAGRVSDAVWANWDFLPTAAEIAGAAPPAGLDGVSVLPALLGRAAPPHPPLYWEFHEGGFTQAARRGKWKGVRRRGGPVELYDLETDPGEARDVAAERADVVAEIEAFMKSARTESAEWPVGGNRLIR